MFTQDFKNKNILIHSKIAQHRNKNAYIRAPLLKRWTRIKNGFEFTSATVIKGTFVTRITGVFNRRLGEFAGAFGKQTNQWTHRREIELSKNVHYNIKNTRSDFSASHMPINVFWRNHRGRTDRPAPSGFFTQINKPRNCMQVSLVGGQNLLWPWHIPPWKINGPGFGFITRDRRDGCSQRRPSFGQQQRHENTNNNETYRDDYIKAPKTPWTYR